MMILPSLLSADVLNLETEIQRLVDAKVGTLHLDVMDQHYVPNLTFGPLFCHAIHQKLPHLLIDVHLMVEPVHELIFAFAQAGAKRISIHPEACTHLDRELTYIREQGAESGLALNPATSIDYLKYTAHRLDFVLVMTVNPGFGGQTLIPECIEKIKQIRQYYPKLSIAVDGGVNLETIQALAQAGADRFVVGSGLFSAKNYEQRLQKLIDVHLKE